MDADSPRTPSVENGGTTMAIAGGGALGMTIVELLVTLAVMVVLASLAYPSLQAMRAEQTVAHVADRLALSLAMGRSAAAARPADTILRPLDGTASFDTGWQVETTDRPGVPLAVVALDQRCLRIALRGTRVARPGEGGPHIRWTGVGYSRSEQGGFFSATFVVRCHGAQRQVRLGAQGRIRVCRPAAGRDCD